MAGDRGLDPAGEAPMLYRVLDLRYCEKKQPIDDEPLQRLLHGHETVAITQQFYRHEGVPHVLVGVQYRLARLAGSPQHAAAPAAPAARPAGDTAEGGPDWKAVLAPGNEKLFETLQACRTARARADAVPPYVILTNVQLAQVSNPRRPGAVSPGQRAV
ncbi:MAG: HRDC domain-containing protein [Planctomycetes bacterium]|nr:HRDC domain-containing protein [Planctomycetota bacterium]